MSQCYIQHHDDAAKVSCDNCDWKGEFKALEIVTDIEERIAPGEVTPAGECPQCHALAYLDAPPTYSAQFKAAAYDRALATLRAAVEHEAEAFANDEEISGADLLEWFAQWRVTAQQSIKQ